MGSKSANWMQQTSFIISNGTERNLNLKKRSQGISNYPLHRNKKRHKIIRVSSLRNISNDNNKWYHFFISSWFFCLGWLWRRIPWSCIQRRYRFSWNSIQNRTTVSLMTWTTPTLVISRVSMKADAVTSSSVNTRWYNLMVSRELLIILLTITQDSLPLSTIKSGMRTKSNQAGGTKCPSRPPALLTRDKKVNFSTKLQAQPPTALLRDGRITHRASPPPQSASPGHPRRSFTPLSRTGTILGSKCTDCLCYLTIGGTGFGFNFTICIYFLSNFCFPILGV